MPSSLQYPLERHRDLQGKWSRLLQRTAPSDDDAPSNSVRSSSTLSRTEAAPGPVTTTGPIMATNRPCAISPAVSSTACSFPPPRVALHPVFHLIMYSPSCATPQLCELNASALIAVGNCAAPTRQLRGQAGAERHLLALHPASIIPAGKSYHAVFIHGGPKRFWPIRTTKHRAPND